MSLIYFIQEHLHLRVHHGGTGNADADAIWLRLGYLPVEFPDRESFSLRAKFRRSLYLLTKIRQITKNDILVFQFPLYAGMSKILVQVLLRKKVRMVCFITDIDGLKDGDAEKLKRELRELSHFRNFIVHNEVMQNWLSETIPAARSACISFFDFLSASYKGPRQPSKEIVFAGNLSKSLFLEKLHELKAQLIWNVYGPGFTSGMREQDCISYKGVVDPYVLPEQAEGSFGLVWDGDSIHGGGGHFGNYMHYITHHKVSLYILAGLPIICYRDAGSAGLIKEYEIGLLIDDLDQLASIVDQVDEHQYEQMRTNMKTLAMKISSGNCLSDAMKEIVMTIQQPETGKS